MMDKINNIMYNIFNFIEYRIAYWNFTYVAQRDKKKYYIRKRMFHKGFVYAYSEGSHDNIIEIGNFDTIDDIVKYRFRIHHDII